MIGVLGGTFDPPHIGHHIMAAEARFQLDLERIIWVLTGVPPHKPVSPITQIDIRLEMLQAAIRLHPGDAISRVEMDRSEPHYAVDTMRLLALEFPGEDLAYLMGSDSLLDLPKWHAPQEFVANCAQLVVMPRPGITVDMDALEGEIPGLAVVVRFLDGPYVALSSRQIRERVNAGAPIDHLVSPAVGQLITDHGLYR